jgi:hypothetical protein
MSRLEATLAKARQLRALGNQHATTETSSTSYLPIEIPPFQPAPTPDLTSQLRSLGLPQSLADGLQRLFNRHIDTHLRLVSSNHAETAQQVLSSFHQSPDLLKGFQANVILFQQAFQSRHRAFVLRVQGMILRDVSAHLARQRGCHDERPPQLGKSFSKARLSFALPPSLPR